ncbi:MAG: hypothetical protein ACRC7G_04965 [Beijerinckiaceae bacterium]
MNAFFAAVIVAIGMGVAAAAILEGGQMSVQEKYVSSSVRK